MQITHKWQHSSKVLSVFWCWHLHHTFDSWGKLHRPGLTQYVFHFIARYEDGTEFLPLETDVCDEETEAYVTNLSYYHLVPFETDILEWALIYQMLVDDGLSRCNM